MVSYYSFNQQGFTLKGKRDVYKMTHAVQAWLQACLVQTQSVLQLCFVPHMERREAPQPYQPMLTNCRPCVSSGQCWLDDADASAHTTDATVCPPPLTTGFQAIKQTALGGDPDQLLQKQYNHKYRCTSMALQQRMPYSLDVSLSDADIRQPVVFS